MCSVEGPADRHGDRGDGGIETEAVHVCVWGIIRQAWTVAGLALDELFLPARGAAFMRRTRKSREGRADRGARPLGGGALRLVGGGAAA